MPKFQNFLETEDARNVKNHRVFERFLKKAVGPDITVMVAHHITYMVDGELPVEIPSADSMWFCPVLMGAVFGPKSAKNIMMVLATRTPEERETVLNSFLDTLEIEQREGSPA